MRLLTHTQAAAAVAAIILASCSGGKGEYKADYAPFDSVPYNVETNTAATTTMVKTFPGSYMFRSEYPQYNAVVSYGIVDVADSAKICKALASQFDHMADRIGIYESEIRTIDSGEALHGWVMVTPQCQAPVQMMVTDSATMILHAIMEFTSPQADSARIVYPATEAIAADLDHMIRHLALPAAAPQ